MRDLESLYGIAGKVALVVGAAEGMGHEIARFLAMAGATVAVADIQGDLAETVAAEIRAGGVSAQAFTVDVSDEAMVVSMVETVRTEFGAIDILVHVAGIQDRALLADITGAVWDRIQSINLRGPFLTMREVAKVMRADKRPGRILAISSMGSLTPVFEGLIAYNASKSGVNGLVRNMAHELAPDGIRVNALLPGNTTTAGQARAPGPPVDIEKVRNLVPPLGRTGRATDIASAALFLVGPGSEWITGQTLVVDGGSMIA